METETEINLYFKTMKLYIASDYDNEEIEKQVKNIKRYRNEFRQNNRYHDGILNQIRNTAQ